MIRVFATAVLVIAMGSIAFADGHLMFGAPEGNWATRGNHLYQHDAGATRAKAWMEVPQDGSMIYEFSMKYEGGLEDGHGGVGLHILSDSFPKGSSWGMGDSWLLWLNYDADPEHSYIPEGLSAQLYRSISDSEMELLQAISLADIEPIAVRYMASAIPVKISYITHSGRVLIADPRGKTAGWYIDLPNGRYDIGRYAAVRTNGMKMSFSSPDVEISW